MATMTSTELEHVQCWCGVPMALPANLVRNARENGQSLYCPGTGHRFGWDAEIDELRKQLERERTRHGATQDQLRAAEHQTRTLKAEITKARKRSANGVCPCCQRSFVQLTRHMKTKHPEFVAEQR
jgi:ssDNA-binding Zn-finger/Zn-ribbon topoisomerase 1